MDWEYVDVYLGAPLPDLARSGGLIVLGGEMSANDDLEHIRTELNLIGQALSLGKPLLGICLGSQLIAKALGARVYANPMKEIGWYPVYWTEAGRKLTGSDTIFHWHGETFDLPPGAELLAWSDACGCQAYRVGRNTYGLQFHLEATPEMIDTWVAQDAGCGDSREIHSSIDPHINEERLMDLAAHLFGCWSDLL
jgi:GMP synthase-like glutamine amidotransferase